MIGNVVLLRTLAGYGLATLHACSGLVLLLIPSQSRCRRSR